MRAILFQSTPPGWEATTHAPHTNDDAKFQSTPPGWEATCHSCRPVSVWVFQSTPPGWEATSRTYNSWRVCSISIHASRMGGDHSAIALPYGGLQFQSTPPGWEATSSAWNPPHRSDFNPRLPDGRRQQLNDATCNAIQFQSTPPGWEATRVSPARLRPKSFQSTPPGWEATHQHGQPDDRGDISIHASRMGGDRNSFGIFTHAVDFNPRLPDGRRPEPMACGSADTTFQSTPPGWEATYLRSIMSQKILISIHASRMGGDSLDRTTVPVFHVFQSTPPGWEATLSNY